MPNLPSTRRVVALCDGTGLIVFPTPDGPDYLACHGCEACRPDLAAAAAERGRAAYAARSARAGGAFALIPGSADDDLEF